MNVLFDTNIILDALQGRDPWREDAEKLIMAVARDEIEGYVTSKQLCDIWYLARQIFKGEENAGKKAQVYIQKLCEIFRILDVTEMDIKNAITYGYSDFEDAVIMAVAERTGMERIVTRNIKDYAVPSSSYKIRNLGEMVEEISDQSEDFDGRGNAKG